MAKANKTVAKDLIERVAILERKLQKVGRIQVGGNPFQGTVINVIDLPDAPDIDTDIYYVSETNSFYYWNTVTETWEVIGGGGGSGSGHIIQDENTNLTARSKLAFQGAGVTAFDHPAGDRTIVSVPGAGAGLHKRAAIIALAGDEDPDVQYDDDSFFHVGEPDRFTLSHSGAWVAGLFVQKLAHPGGTVTARLLLGAELLAEDTREIAAGDDATLNIPVGFIGSQGQQLVYEVEGITDADVVRMWIYGNTGAVTEVTQLGHAMLGTKLGQSGMGYALVPSAFAINSGEALTDDWLSGGTYVPDNGGNPEVDPTIHRDLKNETMQVIQASASSYGYDAQIDTTDFVPMVFVDMTWRENWWEAHAFQPGGPGPIVHDEEFETVYTGTVTRILEGAEDTWEFILDYTFHVDLPEDGGGGHYTWTGSIKLNGVNVEEGPITVTSEDGLPYGQPHSAVYDPYNYYANEPGIFLWMAGIGPIVKANDEAVAYARSKPDSAFKIKLSHTGDYGIYITSPDVFFTSAYTNPAFDSNPAIQTWRDTYFTTMRGVVADGDDGDLELSSDGSLEAERFSMAKLIRSGAEGALTERTIDLPVRLAGFEVATEWGTDMGDALLGADGTLGGERLGVWIKNERTKRYITMGTVYDSVETDPDLPNKLFIDTLVYDPLDPNAIMHTGEVTNLTKHQGLTTEGSVLNATSFIFDPLALVDDQRSMLLSVNYAGGPTLTLDGAALTELAADWLAEDAWTFGVFFASSSAARSVRLDRFSGTTRRFGPGLVDAFSDPPGTPTEYAYYPADRFEESEGAEPWLATPPNADPAHTQSAVLIHKTGLYDLKAVFAYDARGTNNEVASSGINATVMPAVYDLDSWGSDPAEFGDEQTFVVPSATSTLVEVIWEGIPLSEDQLVSIGISYDGDPPVLDPDDFHLVTPGDYVWLSGLSIRVDPAA